MRDVFKLEKTRLVGNWIRVISESKQLRMTLRFQAYRTEEMMVPLRVIKKLRRGQGLGGNTMNSVLDFLSSKSLQTIQIEMFMREQIK